MTLDRPYAWLTFAFCVVAAIGELEIVGRRGARDASDQIDDESTEADADVTMTVLDIARVGSGSI